MKNNLINLLITILLVYMFIFIFLYSMESKEAIIYTEDIFLYNLLPSILPSLIISSLLIKYNFINILSKLFKNIIRYLFNLSESCTFPILISMITGFPTGSKYVKDLLDNNTISIEEANHLIMFTSFSNPIFVISLIGEGLLDNKNLGLLIYLIHVLTGLFIGILFRRKNSSHTITKSISKKNLVFINELKDSIKSSSIILLNMFGIIIFFVIIITIIDKTFPNNLLTLILKGLIEITIGITNISKYRISLRLKASIIGMILSFNGLSIHFQTKSIIEGSRIKYNNYLIARIIHSILCFIFIYFFFYIFI